MEKVLLLSAVTAAISFTVTETKLFKPFREWTTRKSPRLGDLVSCAYCFSHWIAFALVALYTPRLFEMWRFLDYFLTALVIVWLATFQVALLCLLMKKAGM